MSDTETERRERVPANELANLIEANFDVEFTEATDLARNAVETEWVAPWRSRYTDAEE